ncbi:Transcription regulator [Candidatus Terasakiella magnetica]|nr:Transcription regulator [Candidatus Terasakiella magnetica]
MTNPAFLRLIEALLFASKEPVDERTIASRLPEGSDVPQLLAELERHYAVRGINLVRRGNGWAFRTAPDLADDLKIERTLERKLSRAAVETLAIIAYHQPVTRAEIEEVRGVALSKGTLDNLFAAGWVRPKGRRRTPGRPLTWCTTDGFLDHFGLESLSDLPGVKELEAAGLLDARAAAGAYGNRAVDGDRLVDTGPEEEAQLDLLGDEELLGLGE